MCPRPHRRRDAEAVGTQRVGCMIDALATSRSDNHAPPAREEGVPPMFAEAKSLFFQHLIARARSVRTVISYGEALDQFTGFFLAADPYRRLHEVPPAPIEAFLGPPRGRGRKESPVANRYRSLRRFFRWCKARGFVRLDPTEGLSEPRVRVEAVMPYTDEEVRRMMLATR